MGDQEPLLGTDANDIRKSDPKVSRRGLFRVTVAAGGMFLTGTSLGLLARELGKNLDPTRERLLNFGSDPRHHLIVPLSIADKIGNITVAAEELQTNPFHFSDGKETKFVYSNDTKQLIDTVSVANPTILISLYPDNTMPFRTLPFYLDGDVFRSHESGTDYENGIRGFVAIPREKRHVHYEVRDQRKTISLRALKQSMKQLEMNVANNSGEEESAITFKSHTRAEVPYIYQAHGKASNEKVQMLSVVSILPHDAFAYSFLANTFHKKLFGGYQEKEFSFNIFFSYDHAAISQGRNNRQYHIGQPRIIMTKADGQGFAADMDDEEEALFLQLGRTYLQTYYPVFQGSDPSMELFTGETIYDPTQFNSTPRRLPPSAV